MSFLGFCRRAAYFTLDGLKGGVVRKAIKEIGRIDMLDSVSTEVKEYQKAKWEMLRDNITRNVPHCCLRNGIRIGSNSIIGMGSVVTKDIPDGVVAYGNPCRIVRANEKGKVFC